MQNNQKQNLFIAENTGDFELLDSGDGMRLEKWGQYILVRPDPQAIWQRQLDKKEWQKADALFDKDWQIQNKIQQPWVYKHSNLTPQTSLLLYARLTPFKHTGIFPEQSANWEWLSEQISNFPAYAKTSADRQFPISKQIPNSKLKILNLFGYTGATTCLLAKLGCQVTHVDASKPSIAWAKNNAKLNNLPEDSTRWILDDAVKFAQREIKRGVKYDGILMDPPAFGHSPTGKTWKFSEDLPKLLTMCVSLLSPKAKFLLINAYATNTSAIALQNLLEDSVKDLGSIESGELCLKQKNGRLLSTGITARWSAS